MGADNRLRRPHWSRARHGAATQLKEFTHRSRAGVEEPLVALPRAAVGEIGQPVTHEAGAAVDIVLLFHDLFDCLWEEVPGAPAALLDVAVLQDLEHAGENAFGLEVVLVELVR